MIFQIHVYYLIATNSCKFVILGLISNHFSLFLHDQIWFVMIFQIIWRSAWLHGLTHCGLLMPYLFLDLVAGTMYYIITKLTMFFVLSGLRWWTCVSYKIDTPRLWLYITKGSFTVELEVKIASRTDLWWGKPVNFLSTKLLAKGI